MARKPMELPSGLEVRGQTLRVRFYWNGERRSETVPYPQTAKGIQAATRLRDQVIGLIKHGVMDDAKYAELFPESSTARAIQASIPSLGEYTQQWLDSRDIVEGTRENYKSVFNLYWMPTLGLRRIDLVTAKEIRSTMATIAWSSIGVKRNATIKLASVFKSAVKEGLIDRNPMASIDRPKAVKKLVDPYTRIEAEKIIEWMYANAERYSQIYAAFFEFLFFTGLRPGEAMGLRWEDVDLSAKTAQIRRIVVNSEPVERIKTKQQRVILLNERAIGALAQAERLRRLRHLASTSDYADSPFVFPPAKGGLWIKSPSVTTKHFRAALESTGIRPRRQYDTRHTYATMCLMAGMNPAFIANQLGHSVDMLLSTYAKWLNSASDWKELSKLPARI